MVREKLHSLRPFSGVCMEETEFSDKTILNKVVAAEMRPGQEERVMVTLDLRHGEVGYTLYREQVYHKDYNNNVKGDNTVFNIAIKDATGNTTYG